MGILGSGVCSVREGCTSSYDHDMVMRDPHLLRELEGNDNLQMGLQMRHVRPAQQTTNAAGGVRE